MGPIWASQRNTIRLEKLHLVKVTRQWCLNFQLKTNRMKLWKDFTLASFKELPERGLLDPILQESCGYSAELHNGRHFCLLSSFPSQQSIYKAGSRDQHFILWRMNSKLGSGQEEAAWEHMPASKIGQASQFKTTAFLQLHLFCNHGYLYNLNNLNPLTKRHSTNAVVVP